MRVPPRGMATSSCGRPGVSSQRLITEAAASVCPFAVGPEVAGATADTAAGVSAGGAGCARQRASIWTVFPIPCSSASSPPRGLTSVIGSVICALKRATCSLCRSSDLEPWVGSPRAVRAADMRSMFILGTASTGMVRPFTKARSRAVTSCRLPSMRRPRRINAPRICSTEKDATRRFFLSVAVSAGTAAAALAAASAALAARAPRAAAAAASPLSAALRMERRHLRLLPKAHLPRQQRHLRGRWRRQRFGRVRAEHRLPRLPAPLRSAQRRGAPRARAAQLLAGQLHLGDARAEYWMAPHVVHANVRGQQPVLR